ncbi:MAG TPA: hypothetical protein VFK41_01645 [Nocardioidaceae bacterium]|nr:hypothetical protein [Nocardioidaceae bacterium]
MATPRTALLVPGWSAREIRVAAHSANLGLARSTPGEQPYVVGWDVLASPAGFAVVLDVDDDVDHRARWCAHFPTGATLQEAGGVPVPEDAVIRAEQLPLDEASMGAQQARDGLLDRFHVTRDAALSFGDQARAWVGAADFYCLDTAGVRTYWPTSPLEAPLRQTLDDVAIGYGGPVGWSVTAVDEEGWRRVTVESLGRVAWSEWRTG